MEAPAVGGLRTAHRGRLARHQGGPALLTVESTTLLGACPPRRATLLGINRLVADRLQDHALAAAAVELGVEDLLPRAEIEPSVRDRKYDLVGHQVPLHVRVRVVLAVVVLVLVNRLVQRQPLKPVVQLLSPSARSL